MNNFIKIFSSVVAVIAIINISNFEFELGEYYYYILAATMLVLLLISKKIKINYLMLWLVGAAFISISFNKIPTVFSPFSRFLAFVVLVSLIGPLLKSELLSNFRKRTFSTFNILIVIFVIASFIALLLNLPIVLGRGGFTGFFGHAMLLGPMAAISMLSLIKSGYTSRKNMQRFIYYVLAFVSFFACVAAGSRAALIAGLAGVLFFVYKINQGKLTKFLTITLFLGSILILSYPFWEQYADRIISKMSYAEERGDLTVTRTAVWGQRFEEFSSSPVIGVGFASVDISVPNTRFDPYEGRIEPGSSWLAGLSMIGLLGFIPFLVLVFGYMKFILKDKTTSLQSAYHGSLLLLFFIHMIAEGYIFSAGSGLFFYLWLLLGVIDRTKSQNEQLIKKKELSLE